MRVKRGTKRTNRRKKILKQAKGFYGGKSRNFRVAKEAVERSMQYAYRDRRTRKRDFRRLWIVRINAGARQHGLSYNRFMHGLAKAGCELNRKMLADVAVRDPQGFAALANVAKTALGLEADAVAPAPAAVEKKAPEKKDPEKKASEKPKARKGAAKKAEKKAEEKAAEEPEAEEQAAEKPQAEDKAAEEPADEPAEAVDEAAEVQEPAAEAEAADEPAEK